MKFRIETHHQCHNVTIDKRKIQCVIEWTVATDMKRKRRRGISLLELLIVLVIIGILMALLMSAVQRIRESAARTQCSNNMKQIVLAIQNWGTAHRTIAISNSELSRSWMVDILPFTEEFVLEREYRKDLPSGSDENRKLLSKMPRLFSCPNSNARTEGLSSYALPVALTPQHQETPGQTSLHPSMGRFTSLALMEVSDEHAWPWIREGVNRDIAMLVGQGKIKEVFAGNHGDGFHVAGYGGSVHFLPVSIHDRVLHELAQGMMPTIQQ
jgi:prepilin-type N-terminal cleavage/methylation domain-containing protein